MIFERLPRRQTAILLVVSLVVLALVGKRLAAAGTARAPAAQAVSLSQGRSVGGVAASPRLVVYVVGAVRHAGLVRLSEGARVADALERAGGPSRHADLTLVNLAAPVADGQQIVVPTRVVGRRRWRGRGGCRRRRSREAEPRERDPRTARRAPGHRPGDGAEDRRLASDPWSVALCRRPRRDPRHRAREGRAAAGSGDAMIRLQDALDRGWPAVALGALAARSRGCQLGRAPSGRRGARRSRRRGGFIPVAGVPATRPGRRRSRGGRSVVGRSPDAGARSQLPRVADRRSGGRAGRGHGSGESLTVRRPR